MRWHWKRLHVDKSCGSIRGPLSDDTDPLCPSFPARGHFLKGASITEPRTWPRLVGRAPWRAAPWFLLLKGCSVGQPKPSPKGTAFVESIWEMYSPWSNTVFHYALWFFIVFLIMIYYFFYFSLTFAHFNPCSFLALCLCDAVFASVVPRLQYSQHIPSHLADEHALIASYVARLQHCARSVVEQQWAGGPGLIRGRESCVTRGYQLEKALHVGFFLRSYQLCLAEFK